MTFNDTSRIYTEADQPESKYNKEAVANAIVSIEAYIYYNNIILVPGKKNIVKNSKARAPCLDLTSFTTRELKSILASSIFVTHKDNRIRKYFDYILLPPGNYNNKVLYQNLPEQTKIKIKKEDGCTILEREKILTENEELSLIHTEKQLKEEQTSKELITGKSTRMR